jgi:hypothetical protein
MILFTESLTMSEQRKHYQIQNWLHVSVMSQSQIHISLLYLLYEAQSAKSIKELYCHDILM